MKKVKVILFLLLILFLGVYLYFSKFSNKAKNGRENRQNIEQVKIGMDLTSVENIMGEADTVYFINNIKFPNYKGKVFSYYRGPGIYGYLQIVFDPKVDTVIQVINTQE